MISIDTTDGEVRVTIPRGQVNESRLNAFLDWLRLENLAEKSQLTESQADRLAEEIKMDWWTKNRDRIVGQSES